jgi:hypothetical protein
VALKEAEERDRNCEVKMNNMRKRREGNKQEEAEEKQ